MKWMFKFVFLAAALWSGYWYFGAQAQERIYVDLLSESRDQGWTAESRNLGVSGFPNRFDTTFTDLNFRDPSGRWHWRGETFQLKALSYQPNHIIMAWPGEQELGTPEGSVKLNAELLRASLVVSPTSTLPLARFQIEGEQIALNSPEFGTAHIAGLNGALYQDEANATNYLLGVKLTDVNPPTRLSTGLGGIPFLRGAIESIDISAILEFDREIDRLALQNGQPPRPVSAKIEQGKIVWGGSELTVSGEVFEGSGQFIEGSLSFDVQNWEPLFEVFKQATNLSTTELLTLKRALDAIAGGENLAFTVSFANGKSLIGPVTIGPAPLYPF